MGKSIIIHRPDLQEASRRQHDVAPTIRYRVNLTPFMIETAQGKKYFIRTYGCQANIRDEETIKGILESVGFISAETAKEADLIILNTCAVRENAEDKVYGEVGQLKGLKTNKKEIIVALCGCMIQQSHVVDELEQKYRHVDLLFGTHNIHELLSLLEEVYRSKKRLINVISKSGEVIEELPSVRNDKYKAFVNIMFGCDKFCTYCIVPYTRGKERSRTIDDVLKETQQLVNDGYQEVTFLGQNVNAYGKDLHDGTNFATLLAKAAESGIARIRFTTSHPWDFTDEMIEIIAKYDNIMSSIHLPVQSGNDEILRKMGRRYTSQQYKALVDKLKNKIPNLALTTDIIVGFPNETYEQFLDTLAMVEYVQYDGCFTFIYSPRIGTPAANMKDDVSNKEKHRRFDELVDVVEKVGKIKADAMVGRIEKVLVDGYSKKNKSVLSGYTETNKLVHFEGKENLVGKIVKVLITESHLFSFLGEIISE